MYKLDNLTLEIPLAAPKYFKGVHLRWNNHQTYGSQVITRNLPLPQYSGRGSIQRVGRLALAVSNISIIKPRVVFAILTSPQAAQGWGKHQHSDINHLGIKTKYYYWKCLHNPPWGGSLVFRLMNHMQKLDIEKKGY